jgi:hypothetical protein
MSAVYRRPEGQTLKWLLALIVFILVMTMTFDEVFGGDPSDGTDKGAAVTQSSDKAAPSAVPEPTTLVLLGGGLSALYLARRRRKKNK